MDESFDAIKKAVASFNPQQTIIPIRSGFNYQSPSTGLIEFMPLYEKGEEVTLKVVGYHPDNPKDHNLPTILSTISMYDTQTGSMTGIMDGVFLTALRTGAASALASVLLAKPGSSNLGLIGCGAQSVTQLHAISRVFPIATVRIYDVDTEAMLSFKERVDVLGLDVNIEISNLEDIISESDIVCTCTSIAVGEGPLFTGMKSKEHLHINAVGSDFPGKVELPIEFLNNSFVCPDFLEQAVIEGECQQMQRDKIGSDLATVAQNASDYESKKYERTVFDSTGWALEDEAMMRLFVQYAEELQIGEHIEIEAVNNDVKNPYSFLQKPVR